MQRKYLFEENLTKQCKFCARPLPKNYDENLCSECKEHMLFIERDF